MKRSLKAMEQALGTRKYVLIVSAFGVAGGYASLRSFLIEQGLIILPELPTWQIAILVALLIVLWAVVQRCIALEDNLQPRIAISEAHVDRALESLTEPSGRTSEHPAKYVHIVVTSLSESEIENCHASLLSAKQVLPNNEVKPWPFKNPIRLVTASRHEKVVTLSPKVPEHFDVVYASSRTNMMDTSPALRKPNLLGNFFHTPGKYVLHVAVSGKAAPTTEADIEVVWTSWDSITARILPAE